MKKLLILGAGGQGKVVLDLSLTCNKWDKISFLDGGKIGEEVLGCSVIGDFTEYENLTEEYTHAIVAVGDNDLRLKLTNKLLKYGYEVPVLIHPSAVVSQFTNIDVGTVVMPQVVINVSVQVGKACIINTGAIIEHDSNLGDGIHVSPTAALGGAVTVGDKSWICIGAKVINNINIGEGATVGAGAVVINDIENGAVVVGVPAKVK
ncbi:MAG: acetyltransferase [Cellulosilyticaceae bacterium]